MSTIVNGLSLGYRNDDTDPRHNEIHVEIPLHADRCVGVKSNGGDSLDRWPIVVDPVRQPAPVAVCPPVFPTRNMGTHERPEVRPDRGVREWSQETKKHTTLFDEGSE